MWTRSASTSASASRGCAAKYLLGGQQLAFSLRLGVHRQQCPRVAVVALGSECEVCAVSADETDRLGVVWCATDRATEDAEAFGCE